MPGKNPGPWYREGRGWYVWHAGKQHPLGRDKEKAFRRFHQLMAGIEQGPPAQKPTPEPKPEPQSCLTVRQLADRYLADIGRRLSPTPLRVAEWQIKSFVALNGTLLAATVRRQQVEDWITAHPTWGPSTENLAKTRIVAIFRWGNQQDPPLCPLLQGIRKPRIRSRGRDMLLSAEDHERLLAGASPALRNVLFALYESGARPSEVLRVTAQDFHADAAVWILEKHKAGEKTGTPRIVCLTPALVTLCKELTAKYPSGPLFRTGRGEPWGRCGIDKRVRELRLKMGIKSRATPYAYRHSYATDALARGVPDAQVAALLGHASTGMLHRHYSHLTARVQVLKEALSRVR
jgi:integrase